MTDHHKFRTVFGVISTLFIGGLTGCATAPEPAEDPIPVAEPAPLVIPEAAKPEPVVLKQDHPRRYVVVKGDTLWGIASRFLRDPWRWPEVWHSNTQVANPHLIYPGDVLMLVYIDGKPAIEVRRNNQQVGRASVDDDGLTGSGSNYKLSPRIRVEELAQAIPTIPLDVIGPFLTRPLVVKKNELEDKPYVVSSDGEHLITGAGNRIYVSDLEESDIADYAVVRRREAYRDPETGRVLGYEAQHVADARVQRFGDPATLLLVSSNREVLNGDRLVPVEGGFGEFSFIPRAPKAEIKGSIVAVVDGVTQIGQYQVVVLNRGLQDDLEPGHVLAVYQQGKRVPDPVGWGSVRLPDEEAGHLMVFRVFDHLSYALVMDATRPMHVADKVTNP